MRVVPYAPDTRSEVQRVRSAYYKARADNFRENHGENANQVSTSAPSVSAAMCLWQDIVARASQREKEEADIVSAHSRAREGQGGLFEALEDTALDVLGVVGKQAGRVVRWLEESEAERKSKEAEARRRDIEGTEGEEEPQLEDGVFKVEAAACQIESAAAALQQLQREGCDLTAVRFLDISTNYLTSLYAIDLPACDSIDASVNHIDRFIPNQGLSLIRWLDLSKNRLTSVSGLVHCAMLTYLDVSMNRIETLGTLDTLQELEVLRLSGNKVCVLEGLQGLPRLRELDAAYNKLTDARQIVFLPELEHLNLSMNQLSSLHDVQQSLCGLPQLKQLDLHGNPLRSSRDYHMLLLELPKLERLDGVLASALLREQLERVKGKTDVADLVASTQTKYSLKLQQKKAARDAQLSKLKAMENESLQAFLQFEKELGKEEENCIAALRSLVAKGRSGKDKPLSPEEIQAIKDELLNMERERERVRNQSKHEREREEMEEALKLAGMKSNHEKLRELSQADPAKYHMLKQQQRGRDVENELKEGERREQEKQAALRNAGIR